MAGFIQIIEYQTSRIDEIKALSEEMQARSDEGVGVIRGTVTVDRDKPGRHLTIVEFESYEAAMENSNRPETREFASRMAELVDAPPTFHNLDVVETFSG